MEQLVFNFIKDIKENKFEISEELKEKAKEHILDTLGVAVAAQRDGIAEVLKKYLNMNKGSDQCHIIGSNIKANLTDAAFVNGILAHGLDFDDSSWKLIGHPSAVVLPAVLAVGENFNISGRKILIAYIVGVEVSCKVGGCVEPDLYDKGFHATGVIGVIGATAAVSYLIDLDIKQFLHALGIAASSSSGVRQNFGTMTKPFHAGNAASSAVRAAIMAKSGFTSAKDSLTGKYGLFNVAAKGFNIDKMGGQFGKPFEILDPGLFVKPYPSCAATHTAIDAMLELVNKYDFNHNQVKKIKAGTGPVAPIMLIHHNPVRGIEGKFCLEYVLAAAVIDRKIGIDSFTDNMVNRKEVKDLIKKTEIYIHPDFKKCSINEAPSDLEIELSGFRNLHVRKELPKGNPLNPLSREELVQKYKDCTGRVLQEHQVDNSIEQIFKLEDIRDINSVFKNLTPSC